LRALRKDRPLVDARTRWRVTVVVSIGTFMATLDSSIVNVSLPTISRHFGIDIALAQWVALSYLITVAALLLPAGRLADLVGRNRAYVTGLALFTVGSLACGVAPGPGWLIGARAVQALGATLLMATGVAILTDVWPSEQRGRAMGIAAMVVSVGLMTGPPLGGLISGTVGWRWIFYVNLPIGVLGALWASGVLRRVQQERGRLAGFDALGAVALGAAVLALCLALTIGPEQGWLSGGTLGLFAASLGLLVLFLWRQATVREPLLHLALFRNGTFSASSAASLVSFAGQAPVLILLPFYLEGVLSYSEQATGLTIFTVPLLTALMSPAMGRLSDRAGTRWPTVVAMVVRAASFAAMLTLGLHSHYLHIVFALAIMAVGNACFGPANNSALMGSVPSAHRGIAASMAGEMRSVGMVVGTAAGTAIAAAYAYAAQGPSGTTRLDAAAHPAAFVHGLHACLVFAVVCSILAAVISGARPNDAPVIGESQPASEVSGD